jgi:tRNA(adenine34) deaminase
LITEDEKYMRRALKQADKAAARGEVPVGCVIVIGDKVVARGHNLKETRNDPTAHAEIVALRKAGKKRGSWRLDQATVYVTCEPCPMCAGALVWARVKRVVYGCRDPKAGAIDTFYGVGKDPRLNHRFEVASGVLEKECQGRLSGFFKKIRTEL